MEPAAIALATEGIPSCTSPAASAEAGSKSAEALDLLGSWTATVDETETPGTTSGA